LAKEFNVELRENFMEKRISHGVKKRQCNTTKYTNECMYQQYYVIIKPSIAEDYQKNEENTQEDTTSTQMQRLSFPNNEKRQSKKT
jgi:hypothetical protein